MKVNILDGQIVANESYRVNKNENQIAVIYSRSNEVLQLPEGQYVHIPPVPYNAICEALIKFIQFMNNAESIEEVFFIVDEITKQLVIYGYKNA